jgi:hypothetical protein
MSSTAKAGAFWDVTNLSQIGLGNTYGVEIESGGTVINGETDTTNSLISGSEYGVVL